MMIHPTVEQSSSMIEVQLRLNKDLFSYVGASKLLEFDDDGNLMPTEVVFNYSFNRGNEMVGHAPEHAKAIAHLITEAARICWDLDRLIVTREDFKKEVIATTELLSNLVDIELKEREAVTE